MFLGIMLNNTFFTMVTAYLIYHFLKFNFKLVVNIKRLLVFIISFGILNGFVSSVWMKSLDIPANMQFIKSIILTVLSLLIIKYILNIRLTLTILSFCIIMLGVAIGNFSAPLILYLFGINLTPDINLNSIFLYTVTNFLIYGIALLLIGLIPYIRNIGKLKNLKSVGFLLMITLLIVTLNGWVHYMLGFDPIAFTTVFISSLAYLLSSVWYISKYQKYEMKIEEQNQQSFYNESLNVVLQDLRRFKHDHANHLSVILAMHQMSKFTEATDYLKELIHTNDSFSNPAIYKIKNAGLFSIISSKMHKADQLGVKFSLKTLGIVDSIPNIKISELCEIVGIHLDNAIEAAQLSEPKIVNMVVMSTEDGIDITVKNSCSNKPVLEKISVDGYSTKGENRGNGLKIVENILSKNKQVKNVFSFDEKNMLFIQSLKIKKLI